MILYHRTTNEAAKQIVNSGFRDGMDNYLTASEHSGVWLSNVPLDANEGAFGTHLLILDCDLTDADMSEYEWVEDGKGYREFLVPASVVNSRMKILNVEIDKDPEFWRESLT